jgi:hypothetical protein
MYLNIQISFDRNDCFLTYLVLSFIPVSEEIEKNYIFKQRSLIKALEPRKFFVCTDSRTIKNDTFTPKKALKMSQNARGDPSSFYPKWLF